MTESAAMLDHAGAVLEERARRLALPATRDLSTGEGLEVLHFTSGESRYAIDTRTLHSVARIGSVTPIPALPAWFLGASNIRGSIVTLVDIAHLLHPSPAGRDLLQPAYAVLLGSEKPDFGIVADAVTEMSLIAPAALNVEHALPSAAPWVRSLVFGAAILLDGAMLCADPRLSLEQGVTAVTKGREDDL